ncbi:MAG: SsrA-binding protein SmpB [Nitrospirae bacterium]|nr:SsrA-binding protein SmpB [Nitrospirota bacterium]
MKVLAQNKKAYHDYFIEETVEGGISLKGTEVKAIKEGRANLKDSYVIIKEEEAYLINCHISPYSHGNIMNHEPSRTRKLLLHKKEIRKYWGKARQLGYTMIALKLYLKGPKIKVEIGLTKGKKQYEKRERIKERDVEREMRRQ